MHRVAYIIAACSILASTQTAFGQSTVLSSMRDTTVVATDTGAFHMTKSPLEAVLLSAAIPGAGQVYLDQAWKLPILYGLIGGFVYGVYIQNSRYHAMIDSVNFETAREFGPDSLRAYDLAQAYADNREFYRNDRDKWWIYLGLTYIADLIDAYVSANLYDFDVSNPSPSQIQSYYDPTTRTVGMSFTLRF
jgi:hypothetical protein